MLGSDLKVSVKVCSRARVRSSIVRTNVMLSKNWLSDAHFGSGDSMIMGYAGIGWIGNDKMIIVIRFFLYDFSIPLI
jgi:hypothetical protein